MTLLAINCNCSFAETELSNHDIPQSDDDGDVAWLNILEVGKESVKELGRAINICIERWKAAGPEAKKMFALFAISGILAVCRHGHVLVMCDMIRSSEL
jgi:hypothetical protein